MNATDLVQSLVDALMEESKQLTSSTQPNYAYAMGYLQELLTTEVLASEQARINVQSHLEYIQRKLNRV